MILNQKIKRLENPIIDAVISKQFVSMEFILSTWQNLLLVNGGGDQVDRIILTGALNQGIMIVYLGISKGEKDKLNHTQKNF